VRDLAAGRDREFLRVRVVVFLRRRFGHGVDGFLELVFRHLVLEDVQLQVRFQFFHRHVGVGQQHRQRTAGTQRRFEILLALFEFIAGDDGAGAFHFGPYQLADDEIVDRLVQQARPGRPGSGSAGRAFRPFEKQAAGLALDLRAGDAVLVHPQTATLLAQLVGLTVWASFLPATGHGQRRRQP
jgi:hypothetical protein